MQERISQVKKEIKELKVLIKASRFPSTRIIYESQLIEAGLMLRHYRLVKRIEDSGINYDEWLEWAMSLYSITSDFKVISKARDWKEEKSWDCDSNVGARERIEILVGYKIKDRKRGHGDMLKDIDGEIV